jgi:periplasmic copper chaperone A
MKPTIFVLFTMALLTACGKSPEAPKAPELSVSDAVVRIAPIKGRPSAAYFTLHGGVTADRLVAVSSPKAATIELHENRMEGGMMSMQPLTGIDLPARGEIAFQPGGNHAMMFGLDPAVKAGDTLSLHFTFQSGAKVDAEAKAISAGDTMPMDMNMEREGH